MIITYACDRCCRPPTSPIKRQRKTTTYILFKEKLVKAWVDRFTHFDNTATSRVEGIHARLKSYLKRSTFDLFKAWKAIRLVLLNQLSELQSN